MSNPARALARPIRECLYRKTVDDYLRIMRITSVRCLEKIFRNVVAKFEGLTTIFWIIYPGRCK
jgi:hypothetical protein